MEQCGVTHSEFGPYNYGSPSMPMYTGKLPAGIPYWLMTAMDEQLNTGDPRGSFAALHKYNVQGGQPLSRNSAPTSWLTLAENNFPPAYMAAYRANVLPSGSLNPRVVSSLPQSYALGTKKA